MKKSIDQLAIFGGPRLFRSPKPIGQLFKPEIEQYLTFLKDIFKRRQLTDNGPIVQKLEQKLSRFHNTSHCIALANAGIGITMLIQLFAKGRRGEVIIPSFSYRGLPHFAQWAGQLPKFCDVDRYTHTLDPKEVKAAIGQKTTSILAVCNFNHPGDIEGLCKVARTKKVPIFIDSVYAVGSTYQGKILGGFADAEVYSLHATKLLNGFEGGYITTNDGFLAKKLRWQRDFAFPCLDSARSWSKNIIGLNAKLNEMHAAMALLSVEQFESIVSQNYDRFKTYQEALGPISGLALIPYAEGERVNYQMAVIEVRTDWPLTRDQTVSVLRAEGAAISAYYSPPLHQSEHCPAGLEINSLPVSEEISKKYLQLPVGDLVSIHDVNRICQFFSFINEHGRSIADQLSKRDNN